MIKAVFFDGTKEIQTIEGDGIVATARQENLQGIAVVGRFKSDEFLQSIATMAVNAARAFFKTESDTPADQLIINMMITKIKKEAEHSTVKTVAEEAEEVKE